MYVTAKKADLQAFRKGDLNENQFDKRLTMSSLQKTDDHYKDVKVMASILKTSFEDNDDDAFNVRGVTNHLYIKNLGALFNIEASYGSGFFRLGKAFSAVGKKLSVINFDSLIADTISGKVVHGDIISGKNVHPDTVFFSSFKSNDKSQSELRKEKTNAYQHFLQQLKEAIVDYGGTLTSVQSNEQVIVSVSFSDYGNDLPDRVDLQIKKSVLEALDKGSVSRQQAIDKISVREY